MPPFLSLSILFTFLIRQSICILEFNLTKIEPKETTNPFSFIETNITTQGTLSGYLDYMGSNNLFSMQLSFGIPSQSFNVLIDAGSFLLWIPQIDSKDQYPIKNHFTPSISSTYKVTPMKFNQKYLTGEVSGIIVNDIVTVFNTNISMLWGLANETQAGIDCDGILGLGYKYLKQNGHEDRMSLISQLLENGIISHNIYSVKADPEHLEESKIYFGDLHEDFSNENIKGSISSCRLRNTIFWDCRMSHYVIGDSSKENFNKNYYQVNMETVFDTGSNKIVLPFEFFDSYQKVLTKHNCMTDCNDKTCVIACYDLNSMPELAFVFNGNVLKLDPRTIATFIPIYRIFLLDIVFQKIDQIILGIPFFYNYHVGFDGEKEMMMFYSENGNMIRNVNHLTNDNDFILSDHPGLITLIIMGIIIMICAFVFMLFYFFKRKKMLEISLTTTSLQPLIIM